MSTKALELTAAGVTPSVHDPVKSAKLRDEMIESISKLTVAGDIFDVSDAARDSRELSELDKNSVFEAVNKRFSALNAEMAGVAKPRWS